MRITISENSDTPIYQQIVDAMSDSIRSGALSVGQRLPTVRDLADESGISRGTVKHAYDRLEQMGLIEMTQGRGTFVSSQEKPESASKKERAMKAMDRLLDDMQAMSFSMRDIRIFFELKMREREEQFAFVQIGAVDCTPEALSVITDQLSSLPDVEIHQFLLDEVLENPHKLGADLDLIVTTATHYQQLENKVPGRDKLMRMVLSTTPQTVLELARLEKDTAAGIVCVSKRFASIIRKGCGRFSVLGNEPETYYLGSGLGLEAFSQDRDVLILPGDYRRFCSRGELAALESFAAKGGDIVCYDYHIDQGSLLYVAEQVERLGRAGKSRLT